MAYTIQIKRKNAAPGPGDLKQGELGLDLTNKKLYVGMGNESPLPVRMGEDEIKIADITGLQSALAGKVPVTRKVNNKLLDSDITITASDIGAIPSNQKGQANGVAGLDANGKIPMSQIPDTIINQMEFKGVIEELDDLFTKSTFTNYQIGWFFIAGDTIPLPDDGLANKDIGDWAGKDIAILFWNNPSNTHVLLPGDWLVVTNKTETYINMEIINNNASDVYVPLIRKINGKTLTSDITLTLEDITDTIDCGSW